MAALLVVGAALAFAPPAQLVQALRGAQSIGAHGVPFPRRAAGGSSRPFSWQDRGAGPRWMSSLSAEGPLPPSSGDDSGWRGGGSGTDGVAGSAGRAVEPPLFARIDAALAEYQDRMTELSAEAMRLEGEIAADDASAARRRTADAGEARAAIVSEVRLEDEALAAASAALPAGATLVSENVEMNSVTFELSLPKSALLTPGEWSLSEVTASALAAMTASTPSVSAPGALRNDAAADANDDDDDDVSRGSGPGGVFIEAVAPGSPTFALGLRAGDRIVATSASVGPAMWPKNTVDGVASAVRSRIGDNVRFRLERALVDDDGAAATTTASNRPRSAKAAAAGDRRRAAKNDARLAAAVRSRSVVTETFELELSRPLGMTLAEVPPGAGGAVNYEDDEDNEGRIGDRRIDGVNFEGGTRGPSGRRAAASAAGVYVASITTGGNAARSGVQPGDRVEVSVRAVRIFERW